MEIKNSTNNKMFFCLKTKSRQQLLKRVSVNFNRFKPTKYEIVSFILHLLRIHTFKFKAFVDFVLFCGIFCFLCQIIKIIEVNKKDLIER